MGFDWENGQNWGKVGCVVVCGYSACNGHSPKTTRASFCASPDINHMASSTTRKSPWRLPSGRPSAYFPCITTLHTVLFSMTFVLIAWPNSVVNQVEVTHFLAGLAMTFTRPGAYFSILILSMLLLCCIDAFVVPASATDLPFWLCSLRDAREPSHKADSLPGRWWWRGGGLDFKTANMSYGKAFCYLIILWYLLDGSDALYGVPDLCCPMHIYAPHPLLSPSPSFCSFNPVWLTAPCCSSFLTTKCQIYVYRGNEADEPREACRRGPSNH